MPDERTPVELAKEIMVLPEDDTCRECDPDCMCSERKARRVAAALIERSTPVEVKREHPEDLPQRSLCPCCRSSIHTAFKFCPNCGVPILWKQPK